MIPPFNANVIALKIASVVLQDVQHLNRVISENKRNRGWFEKELKKLQIKCLPSAANFTFLECTQDSNISENIYKLLLQNGIIIRQLESYGLLHCLRITIGTRQEMEKTVDVLIKGNFSS